MAYNATYSSGDVAKAGQNTITTIIIEAGSYAGLLVLGVIVGLAIGFYKKMKK
jgi:hypothetical protein